MSSEWHDLFMIIASASVTDKLFSMQFRLLPNYSFKSTSAKSIGVSLGNVENERLLAPQACSDSLIP